MARRTDYQMQLSTRVDALAKRARVPTPTLELLDVGTIYRQGGFVAYLENLYDHAAMTAVQQRAYEHFRPDVARYYSTVREVRSALSAQSIRELEKEQREMAMARPRTKQQMVWE